MNLGHFSLSRRSRSRTNRSGRVPHGKGTGQCFIFSSVDLERRLGTRGRVSVARRSASCPPKRRVESQSNYEDINGPRPEYSKRVLLSLSCCYVRMIQWLRRHYSRHPMYPPPFSRAILFLFFVVVYPSQGGEGHVCFLFSHLFCAVHGQREVHSGSVTEVIFLPAPPPPLHSNSIEKN